MLQPGNMVQLRPRLLRHGQPIRLQKPCITNLCLGHLIHHCPEEREGEEGERERGGGGGGGDSKSLHQSVWAL